MKTDRKKLAEFGQDILDGLKLMKEARWTFFNVGEGPYSPCGCAVGLGFVGSIGSLEKADELWSSKGSRCGDPIYIISSTVDVDEIDIHAISGAHIGGMKAEEIAIRLIEGRSLEVKEKL